MIKGRWLPLYTCLLKTTKVGPPRTTAPPPSRPVCGGNKGFNRHLSELLSLLLEPTGHAIEGNDIDSTSELLLKVEKLNEQMKKWKED